MTLLRLKYLKVYRDRHGTVRRYFHKRGQMDIPLKGEPGTAEFMLAYQAAIGTTAPAVDETKAGTFARLIADYCRSAAFANLKPSSQKLYRVVLDRIAERHGHRLVRDARRSDARKMVEEIGAAKPAMANITRAVLRLLMQYAVETELRLDNPVRRWPSSGATKSERKCLTLTRKVSTLPAKTLKLRSLALLVVNRSLGLTVYC